MTIVEECYATFWIFSNVHCIKSENLYWLKDFRTTHTLGEKGTLKGLTEEEPFPELRQHYLKKQSENISISLINSQV